MRQANGPTAYLNALDGNWMSHLATEQLYQILLMFNDYDTFTILYFDSILQYLGSDGS